jgi:hypothetical protein
MIPHHLIFLNDVTPHIRLNKVLKGKLNRLKTMPHEANVTSSNSSHPIVYKFKKKKKKKLKQTKIFTRQ